MKKILLFCSICCLFLLSIPAFTLGLAAAVSDAFAHPEFVILVAAACATAMAFVATQAMAKAIAWARMRLQRKGFSIGAGSSDFAGMVSASSFHARC